MPRSTTWRRRLLPPLIILIVGGGLVQWAAHRERERLQTIRLLTADLCLSAAAGEDLTGRVPASDPLLTGALDSALRSACEPPASARRTLEVVAASSDAPGFSDGLATHHAVIRIAGADRLILRFIFEDNDPVIVGYALPPATGPPAP